VRSAYLEPSFLNRAVDEGRSANDVRSVLERRQLRPVVGLHAIYEMSRTLLEPGHERRARALFSLVRDLAPSYHWFAGELLDFELQKLRRGVAVLPFLDHDNCVRATHEVEQLASGVLSDEGRRFINAREADIAAHFPESNRLYLQQIDHVRAEAPDKMPQGRQFAHTCSYFAPSFPEFIEKLLHPMASPDECRELAVHLERFPALRSVLNAHLYMIFIMLANKRPPGKDKLDDYRHIVEACYTDTFVTADRQQATTAPKINPSLEVLPSVEFWSGNVNGRRHR
jgi:hypothetical protein